MNTLEDIFEELGFDRNAVKFPEGAAIYALARTYGLVMRRLSRVYGRFGLSAASFNLLVLLERGKDPDSFTQQAIGERLVVSPSDMTGLIDRMEAKGLVRRTPGKDRRSKLLRITPKGSQLLKEAWPAHVEEIKQLCHAMKTEDHHVLARALRRLRQA